MKTLDLRNLQLQLPMNSRNKHRFHTQDTWCPQSTGEEGFDAFTHLFELTTQLWPNLMALYLEEKPLVGERSHNSVCVECTEAMHTHIFALIPTWRALTTLSLKACRLSLQSFEAFAGMSTLTDLDLTACRSLRLHGVG